jgi:hypothetical protein
MCLSQQNNSARIGFVRPIGNLPVVYRPVKRARPMNHFDLGLSSAAIENIVIDTIQDDFAFVVGSQSYNCPRILAEFLSPRVYLSHSVDPSIAEYVVENQNSGGEFELFLSLGLDSTISITEANVDFFLSLSREFGNSNLYISLLEHFESGFIYSQLHDSMALDLLGEDMIGRVSSDFYRLRESQLSAIPVFVLFHILSHHLLMISNEDTLFFYIISHLCSDRGCFDLLQFVRFDYLSTECISHFLSSLPDSIDRCLWESLSQRLISEVCFDQVYFPFKAEKSLEGIISYLTQRRGGTVHDRGIVTTASKSVLYDDPRYAVRNLGMHFHSTNGPGQWICWDFREMRVIPTHYTIRCYMLKSWVLESSLDFANWTEIDRKTDNEDFKGLRLRTASFAISKSAECRFIRLTHTGKTHDGYEYGDLGIITFEVFGTLLE